MNTMTVVDHVYVNYYRDGNDFCPTHRHKGTEQIIISLGATRRLHVGKRYFELDDGDVIVFGSSNHGVPQESGVTEGRISIAVFVTSHYVSEDIPIVSHMVHDGVCNLFDS